MFARRAKFAAVLATVAAPIYFVIQLLFGADAGEAVVRAVLFLVLLFLVSLAIDWDKKRAAPTREETGSQDSPPDSG